MFKLQLVKHYRIVR